MTVCPLMRDVCPQEGWVKTVFTYERCLPTGGVGQDCVSTYERCLPTGGVGQDCVSTCERCLPIGGVGHYCVYL